MTTKTRTLRLGERAEAQADGLCAELGLSQADLYRTSLAALDSNEGMKTEIKAASAAQGFLDRLAATYGEKANLRFTVDEVDAMPPLRVLMPGRGEELVPGTEVYSRDVDGRVHFDLYDQEADVMIESIRIANVGDAVHLLSAIHLRTPVPAIREAVQLAPEGSGSGTTYVTVWGRRGASQTFEVGPDSGVLPNRRAFFGRPT